MDRGESGVIGNSPLVSSGWRKALGLLRLLLALAALTILVRFAEPSGVLAKLLLGAFVGYASWLLLYCGNGKRTVPAVLVFVFDSVFFLTCATIEAPAATWLCAALFLLLMGSGALFHPWRRVLLASIVCVGLFPLVRPDNGQMLVPAFAGVAAFAVLGGYQRQGLERQLATATVQATAARSEIDKAREVERERLAADFHDGPMQSFISLQMRLEIVRRMLERDPEAAKAELVQLQQLTKSQVADIRAFVRGMRPVDVEGAGFTSVLSRLVDTFHKDTGISATFLGAVGFEPGDAELGRELLKIVREALHNVQKHADASRVAVGLDLSGGAVEVMIQDDGSGFPFAGTYSLEELDLLRIGPESIKKRVRRLGGDLVVESRPNLGAGLKVRVPL